VENEYTEKATRAVTWAAAKIFTDASINNRSLPLGRNGRVEYVIPAALQLKQLVIKVK